MSDEELSGMSLYPREEDHHVQEELTSTFTGKGYESLPSICLHEGV